MARECPEIFTYHFNPPASLDDKFHYGFEGYWIARFKKFTKSESLIAMAQGSISTIACRGNTEEEAIAGLKEKFSLYKNKAFLKFLDEFDEQGFDVLEDRDVPEVIKEFDPLLYNQLGQLKAIQEDINGRIDIYLQILEEDD